jgi:hypothetical protein
MQIGVQEGLGFNVLFLCSSLVVKLLLGFIEKQLPTAHQQPIPNIYNTQGESHIPHTGTGLPDPICKELVIQTHQPALHKLLLQPVLKYDSSKLADSIVCNELCMVSQQGSASLSIHYSLLKMFGQVLLSVSSY